MRIAQVAPLYESVPPQFYGGTERVVSYLTEELVRLGHDVTLFASGDSQTRARLIAPCPRGLRLDERYREPTVHHALLLELLEQHRGEFDIVHYHLDSGIHLPLARRARAPRLTTIHNRLDGADWPSLYHEFSDEPLVSISDAQRAPLPTLNWQGTVYHGLPLDLHQPRFAAGRYLAFLGRTSPEKGLKRAIEIALRAGVPLRIAAKIDAADRAYFADEIEPLLRWPTIEYLGEIGDAQKTDFLGNARALLFPIDWPEPFWLVVIEALACGTPVIAFRRGSVTELVDDGVTGYIVDDADEANRALATLERIDRRRCRETFEARFSAPRMTRAYLGIYQQLCHGVR